jgi:hypothetical protein
MDSDSLDRFWARISERDFKGAALAILNESLAGDILAQCNLGHLVLSGLVLPSDIGLTAEIVTDWLQVQSDRGSGMASFALAQGCINRVIVPLGRDRKEQAKEYLELAESQGVSFSTLFGDPLPINVYLGSTIDSEK